MTITADATTKVYGDSDPALTYHVSSGALAFGTGSEAFAEASPINQTGPTYQLGPVTHKVLHADFYRVAMDKLIQVTIPVVVKGEPKGVKQQGGILEFIRREIEVECLPADIPENVEVDVSEMMLHQGIRVRDLTVDPKWTPKSDPDMMLVHVIMPKAEEVAAPAAEAVAAAPAAPAEPEVIKKGKKEEAEEEKEEKKK